MSPLSVNHLPPLRHREARDGVPVAGQGPGAGPQLEGPNFDGLVSGAREEAVTVPEEAKDAVAVAAQYLGKHTHMTSADEIREVA